MNFEELEKEMKETCDHIDYDDCDYTGHICDLNCRDGLILRKFKRCLEYEKKQAVKEFAEKFREQLEQYRLDNEYFTADEPNGNLWQMNSSVFYLEVIDKGGLIDELVKGYNNDD